MRPISLRLLRSLRSVVSFHHSFLPFLASCTRTDSASGLFAANPFIMDLRASGSFSFGMFLIDGRPLPSCASYSRSVKSIITAPSVSKGYVLSTAP